jgi:hypothetical protein
MLRKDDIKLGIVLGFFAPLVAMVLYYFIVLSQQINFSEYFFYLKTNRSLLTGVSSISLVANAVLFTFYINSRKDKTAKGLFLATVIYGIVVLLAKVIP